MNNNLIKQPKRTQPIFTQGVCETCKENTQKLNYLVEAIKERIFSASNNKKRLQTLNEIYVLVDNFQDE